MSSENNDSDPWYRNGLRFTCTQCGNCCTGSPGYVWVTDEEVQAIADYLDQPVGAIRLLHTRPALGRTSLTEHLNGDCVFFDPQSRGCRIYPVRPVQCRTWPFWAGNLEAPADWTRTQQTCPGSGRGDLVNLVRIEELLSQRQNSGG